MERTERLLDLVALLLDAKEPLPWSHIRAAFPEDYGPKVSAEAAERKFERDKAELQELGIPLSYVHGHEDKDDGYVVDRDAYYLPELKLTPDELAVLYAAGSAALASGAFPARGDLAHALRKIGFYAGPTPTAPKVRLELGGVASSPQLPERLEQLWSAISNRKCVELQYFSPHRLETTERTVDPYGLALRRGLWSLVGYCHLRKGIRTFHVHRIRQLTLNPKNPKSPDFEIPKDFALDEYVATWPWQHRFHAPIDVTVALSPELTPLAERLFPSSEKGRDTSASEVRVRATDLDGLLKYVLSLGGKAKVVAPPEAVTQWRAMADTVVRAHR